MGASTCLEFEIFCASRATIPRSGDHKEAKPVYDLDSVQVMQLVQGLNKGHDLAGHKLDGSSSLNKSTKDKLLN